LTDYGEKKEREIIIKAQQKKYQLARRSIGDAFALLLLIFKPLLRNVWEDVNAETG
jgi:hypothetical protein